MGSSESLNMHRNRFFIISLVEWEAWKPRIIENESMSIHCLDFCGGVGIVGSPESPKMYSFRYIFQDFLSEVGIVGSPESLEIKRFHQKH